MSKNIEYPITVEFSQVGKNLMKETLRRHGNEISVILEMLYSENGLTDRVKAQSTTGESIKLLPDLTGVVINRPLEKDKTITNNPPKKDENGRNKD